MTDLNRIRADIERIDRELVRLLGERLDTIRAVGRVKGREPERPLFDAQRERALFEFWCEAGRPAGLSPYYLGRVLREVLTWSRRDQEKFLDGSGGEAREGQRVVAFQGAPWAYSDLAARKLFAARGGEPETRGMRTFAACLDALEAGQVDYALLPIENSIAGSIHEVYGLLGERDVHLVDEEEWLVEHCLAALPGAQLEGLRLLRSHPVALQQCGSFLGGLPGVRAEAFHDTAAAASAVAEAGDLTQGALCSEEAAQAAGLVVLRREVADNQRNVTRFVLVGREPEPVDARLEARTSLILVLEHHQGALAHVLSLLARGGVNLTKLESRPLSGSPWRYRFHLDVEGDARRAPLVDLLDELRAEVAELRVLGSYPLRAGTSEPHPAAR